MSEKKAIIIGAGPAGLTTAYELLQRTQIKPIILEKTNYLGGISRTINYKGNRIDIGGHRFFSKSDRVMQWWQNMMPIQATLGSSHTIQYQGKKRDIDAPSQGPNPEQEDRVMLIRSRKSRIFFNRTFFEYPLSLSLQTVMNLGLIKMIRIGASYCKSNLFPIRDEKNLEQFLINRFGKELYLTFFKSYTEKVWGVPCDQISAEWGAQRIKGLSISTAIKHFFKSLRKKKQTDIAQKNVETSLIEQFLYPKFGPGHMWEETAKQIASAGAQITSSVVVDKIIVVDKRVVSVEGKNVDTGERHAYSGDYFFSTMPIKDLVQALSCQVPDEIKEISQGLQYRDFITVGLLCKKLKITEHSAQLIQDNWIYIQEPDVLVGRLQIFNNWSPYMVADQSKVWLGLEYFCNDTDELWRKPDAQMIALATLELEKMGIIEHDAVEDATVIRMEKTYPAYFGTYDRFEELRAYLDTFENLYLLGRNGMHRYNNQDHSMLTAMVAVDNICANISDKSNIWQVNTEQEYHEQKQ